MENARRTLPAPCRESRPAQILGDPAREERGQGLAHPETPKTGARNRTAAENTSRCRAVEELCPAASKEARRQPQGQPPKAPFARETARVASQPAFIRCVYLRNGALTSATVRLLLRTTRGKQNRNFCGEQNRNDESPFSGDSDAPDPGIVREQDDRLDVMVRLVQHDGMGPVYVAA